MSIIKSIPTSSLLGYQGDVLSSDGPLRWPHYVHKWSRRITPYIMDDLRPPDRIWYLGDGEIDCRGLLAVGGTRSPTAETFSLVGRVIGMLARRGHGIISGGVPGVDLASHLASLACSTGRTYAVMANPVEYGLGGHEWDNALLDRLIPTSGGFISEYSEHIAVASAAYRERLLRRDRIISGLARAMIVFECNYDSATVDTAIRALNLGKPVIAIDTRQRTVRRGIDQLRCDFGLTVISEEDLNDDDIVTNVIEHLKLEL